MKKIPLHSRILIGIFLGLLFGVIFLQFPAGAGLVRDWVKPFGDIFINLLKLIAIPLIITSLIKGIADLKDVGHLGKMGGITFSLYILTSIIAISIGLFLVNTFEPGNLISDETRTEMLSSYGQEAESRVAVAENIQEERGPLQALVEVVPENFFGAASSNGNMLQVIFFTILFGVAMIMVSPEKVNGVKDFISGANDIVLKMVDIIMTWAPYGVFALMMTLVIESPSSEVFVALGAYGLTLIFGLALLTFGIYPLMVRLIGKMDLKKFYKGIAPAQLVAFSTSSSAATLPVTMECIEENLKVDKKVSSFVLPIGATINMDGTTMYQAVAAVFIAQVLGYDLTLMDQLAIVLTATLAGIGSAAVPGAGILMLVIVLESVGVDPAGIALIFAVDRPLDMCRTVVNVTGDIVVATIVQRFSNKEGATDVVTPIE